MKVTCLTSQESLFETRLLKRMADPVFLSPATLLDTQEAPLLLFGNWYEAEFYEGLKWLSSIAYSLRFPCIVFPPFKEGSIGQILGLQVSLEVKTLNRNLLKPKDEVITLVSGKSEFRVQSDFGFIGPAGKPLAVDSEENIAVVVVLQPKNTATPLLLCGARIFSSSGLSNEEDRQILFEGLLVWITRWQAQSVQLKSLKSEATELTHEKLKSICVLLAGTGATNPKELIHLADSILGIDISFEELDVGLRQLSQYGFVTINDDSVSVNSGPLGEYIQKLGLWSHVRMLKSDFVKKEQ